MPDRFPFIDCQGLGGHYTLGAVQTGDLTLVHRVSAAGDFGDTTVADNRHLVGDDWQLDAGDEPGDWTPGVAAFVCGLPPCSGFSNLNTHAERGPGAAINRCMWDLVEYAGGCTGTDLHPGPEIVSLESVQGAFKKGRVLMQALRDHLEGLTSQQYDLHHVLMSGSTVGAAQYRHRYFMVLARVEFGVDPPKPRRIATVYDAVGDLQGLELTWGQQPYKYAPSELAKALRDPAGSVEAHACAQGKMAHAVAEASCRGWQAGTYLSEAFDALDMHPPEFARARAPEGIRRGRSSYKGLNWPLRVNPDKPGYVLAGSCARDFAHWTEPRLLTVRELSRLMGFPDTWRWPTAVTRCSSMIGKGCPVQSSRWISTWVVRALRGEAGRQGKEIAPAEYLYDFTHMYKDWL